ncbi:MAG: hypothetical protein HOP19_29035 [Acidobacteria bacterium]|nr:hypothetical protein [Acidobacteriota bacterium]
MRGERVAKDIDEYIASFPTDVRAKLEKIRATISKAAPKAEEVIKFASKIIPVFWFQNRNCSRVKSFVFNTGITQSQ